MARFPAVSSRPVRFLLPASQLVWWCQATHPPWSFWISRHRLRLLLRSQDSHRIGSHHGYGHPIPIVDQYEDGSLALQPVLVSSERRDCRIVSPPVKYSSDLNISKPDV